MRAAWACRERNTWVMTRGPCWRKHCVSCLSWCKNTGICQAGSASRGESGATALWPIAASLKSTKCVTAAWPQLLSGELRQPSSRCCWVEFTLLPTHPIITPKNWPRTTRRLLWNPARPSCQPMVRFQVPILQILLLQRKAKQEQETAASMILKQLPLLKRHSGRLTRTGIFALSKENKDCRRVKPVFNLKIPRQLLEEQICSNRNRK